MPTKDEKTTKKATNKTTKVAAKKPATKKTTTKKATTKKSTSKKTTTKTAKKPVSKVKTVEKQIQIVQKPNNNNDDLLDILKIDTDASKEQKKQPAKKPQGSSKQTKKPTAKKPVKIVQQPKVKHRTKLQTKEEKQMFKRLSESFNYVANLTMVIEERKMDKELINDLTLGEIHVLEVVNQQTEMPMTKVANQLKITVGSLTTCVNRLVKKEYLDRVRDDVDHRIIKISTTAKAKRVLKMHDAFHEEILLTVLDGITIKDATKVMEQFERVLENYYNPKEKNYEAPTTNKKKK